MAKAEKTEAKYGVPDLAEKMGVEVASARVALRKHNIKKNGSTYGWDTISELNAVAEKCKSAAKATKDKGAKKGKKKVAKAKVRSKRRAKAPAAAEAAAAA